MDELAEGRAKLKDCYNNELFEVEYSIRFRTTLQFMRTGSSPVAKTKAEVRYIRALNGNAIAPGEYLLERDPEINRVKNLGGDSWHVLSWPRCSSR
jgi:hypothetical protein